MQWRANAFVQAIAKPAKLVSAKLVCPLVILTSVVTHKELYVMPCCPTCGELKKLHKGSAALQSFSHLDSAAVLSDALGSANFRHGSVCSAGSHGQR